MPTPFECLAAQTGEWVTTARLAETLRLSPDGVAREMKGLSAEGYRIESDPELGYRLLGMDDRIIPAELARRISTKVIGCRILSLESTPSTNDAAWEQALSGAPEGTVVFAEEQTAGRRPAGAELAGAGAIEPALFDRASAGTRRAPEQPDHRDGQRGRRPGDSGQPALAGAHPLAQ